MTRTNVHDISVGSLPPYKPTYRSRVSKVYNVLVAPAISECVWSQQSLLLLISGQRLDNWRFAALLLDPPTSLQLIRFFCEIFLQRLIKLTQDSDAILFILSKHMPWYRQCQLSSTLNNNNKITAHFAFAVKAAAALRRESECVLI